MSDPIFRIHPAIGFARVGESQDFYLQPETSAGTLAGDVAGGLPLRAGSPQPDHDETITDRDLRDGDRAMKRQGARFKIFQYSSGDGAYPHGGGDPITIGSKLADGREVKDIVWTVHLANKKANWFGVNDFIGIDVYNSNVDHKEKNDQLVLRNPGNPPEGPELKKHSIGYKQLEEDLAYLSTQRKDWVIDPGPRAIRGTSADSVAFDAKTTASYGSGGTIKTTAYPISFPSMHFKDRSCPAGEIDTLGELKTDQFGRLIVLPAFGRACAVNGAKLEHFVDNKGWFDDTADGSVNATLILDQGDPVTVVGAWVVTTDPAYAPQIRNAVSLWDDVFDTFIQKLALEPKVFDGAFNTSLDPGFEYDLGPFFRAAGLQRWIANLPAKGVLAHEKVEQITELTDSTNTELHGLGVIRNPDDSNAAKQQFTMPLSLGDAGQSFMSPTPTQYFFLKQWDSGKKQAQRTTLGPGEALDRAALENCLGGRFSPGIDITFICRDVNLYVQNWQAGAGPFRIDVKPIDYGEAAASGDLPFLTVGYVPLQPAYGRVEPGDICKFMAIPWHADYNSCATHLPEPNPTPNNTLFWSWPAQRPVAVHVASDVVKGSSEPPHLRFSVRGTGTPVPLAVERDANGHPTTNPPTPLRNAAGDQISEVWNVGRYQNTIDMITHWSHIGTVLQAPQVESLPNGTPSDWFVEAESQLEGPEDPVHRWPKLTVPPAGLDQALL